MQLLQLFWLASVAVALGHAATCPGGVPGCLPEANACRVCHPTCLYCQRIGDMSPDGVCGPDDCLQCLHGYRFIEKYEDGTGECTDRPAIFKATCPQSFALCSPENECESCDSSCEYCQGETQVCGVKDCMSCREGFVHHELFDDGTGECLRELVVYLLSLRC
ncbi:uncharacterized protein MONBRDRAFT_25395 [Monosiga brevicollis MX1]|uniref:TNFR-Cys domain-containing protein n=1 Tax=Monosiga brevicollis TaxID=81824 RepID=A9UZA5_MONBE|nr:uncharacterized protein MONBRDRAFT_25395 [Monosiga brevicollis MX1]EDQ89198.1 predicted protein [Monosiga brevicollis MX1]|eukprot:XP_001745774.1 hypothetical protein [Monosiga brevicollis MX1]